MTAEEFKKWAIECHAKTNHYYDESLNNTYSFHLKMAVLVGEEFKDLLPAWENLHYGESHVGSIPVWLDIVKPAIWGHDLIEDARQNYNAILKRSNKYVAEIIRAVTNNSRGRSRVERMPDYVYDDIVKTPNATFVKLCDRIANVRYSQWMRSGMLDVYRQEQTHFLSQLYYDQTLNPMWELLNKLLKD